MSHTPDDGRLERLDAALAQIRALFETGDEFTTAHGRATEPGAIDDDRLSNLYVTGVHLHQTLEREELLTRLRELLINVVGAVRFRVYLRVPGTDDELGLVADEAPGTAGQEAPKAAGDTARQVASTGTPYYGAGDGGGNASRPVAVVPLRADEDVLGVVSVDALLPQKGALGRGDREMLEHIGHHAARALLAAGAWCRLQQVLGDPARTSEEALSALLGGASVDGEMRAR